MIKKIDQLGRMVIPREYRQALHLENQDPLEITLDADRIIIKKYTLTCHFCSEVNNLIFIGEKAICRKCIEIFYKAKTNEIIERNT